MACKDPRDSLPNWREEPPIWMREAPRLDEGAAALDEGVTEPAEITGELPAVLIVLNLHQRRLDLVEFHAHAEEVFAVAHITDLGQGCVRGEEGVGNDLYGQVAAPQLPGTIASHPAWARSRG